SIPMFRSCTTEQLDRLAALGTGGSRSDADVVTQGARGDDFFVITSGKGRVTRAGREVAELGPGDYFGELSLFDPAPRNATVAALGPMSLVSLSRDSFAQALDEMPQIRDALLHGMAHRIHELDARP